MRRRLSSPRHLSIASSRAGSTARTARSIAARRYLSALASRLAPSASMATGSKSRIDSAMTTSLSLAATPVLKASSRHSEAVAAPKAIITCCRTSDGSGGTGRPLISASSAARVAVSR
eukprot:scaffold16900_cov105-Isochrysis_galbana.AAC.3